jgi:hypothetical protein
MNNLFKGTYTADATSCTKMHCFTIDVDVAWKLIAGKQNREVSSNSKL